MTHISITEEQRQQGAVGPSAPHSIRVWENLMQKNELIKQTTSSYWKTPFWRIYACSCHFQIQWLISFHTKMCDLAALRKQEPSEY